MTWTQPGVVRKRAHIPSHPKDRCQRVFDAQSSGTCDRAAQSETILSGSVRSLVSTAGHAIHTLDIAAPPHQRRRRYSLARKYTVHSSRIDHEGFGGCDESYKPPSPAFDDSERNLFKNVPLRSAPHRPSRFWFSLLASIRSCTPNSSRAT